MRKCIYLLVLMIPLLSCGKKVPAGAKTDTFKVWGNCGMCKRTIEKSLRIDGVYKASWDRETKMITVSYDPNKISLDSIHKRIAAVGYDNDSYKADKADYDGLHECCKYERKD